jgi:hypothetical protein
MNGIMPGPLWLAIASAASTDSLENGNPTRPARNANVSRETTLDNNHVLVAGANGDRWRAEQPVAPCELEHKGG